MKKVQIIPLVLFPYDVMVMCGVTVDYVKKHLLGYGVDIEGEIEDYLKKSGKAHTVKLPNRAVLIYFPNKDIVTDGLVAHEVFHAVWMVLATMGVEPSMESEEVYAYMIEYLIDKII